LEKDLWQPRKSFILLDLKKFFKTWFLNGFSVILYMVETVTNTFQGITTMARTSKVKSNIEQSVIKRGQIYCVNSKKNTTPYWGGETCDTHIEHDGNIVRFVCSSCVAKLVPAPKPKNTPKVDPVTGEKRKRGRPKGSTNKPKTAVTKTKTTRTRKVTK
jgi:hypothetical protein